MALREVTNSQNMEPQSRLTIEGGINTQSKVSIATIMSEWSIELTFNINHLIIIYYLP